MAKYRGLSQSLSAKIPSETPQSVQTPGTVQNNAGGFVYEIDKFDQLERFLILGSEGGTYHVTERKLTLDNAKNVIACVKEDGVRAVDMIVDVSDNGRSPKNSPALFALAIAASQGNDATRKAALNALPKVARIGTHLFEFAHYVDGFRGWGPALRNAVARWYNEMKPDRLALQVVKYPQRTAEEGNSKSSWSHDDLLRKAHPVGDKLHNSIYEYVSKEGKLPSRVPNDLAILEGANKIKEAKTEKEVISLIEKYELPHELVPKNFASKPDVWRALLPNMPITATLRTLNRLTSYNVLKPLSEELKMVVSRLTDVEKIKKGRVHPISVLAALKTYGAGRGVKGDMTWSPLREIMDALDDMMYLAFDTIEPSGKNILIALDVSGSMSSSQVAGMPFVTAREASAVMAMATARAEKNYHIVGFTANGYMHSGCSDSRWGGSYPSGITPINISPRQRLDDVIKTVAALPMGGTNCALPMLYALDKGLDVDGFFVYTDNETWSGNIKPAEALRKYRNQRNPQAKSVVVATDATPFTIADPNDPGSLDVVGFDTSAPAVMSDFLRKPFRTRPVSAKKSKM